MPLTTFATENVRTSATSFPKVKLRLSEKGRIVCVEKQPVFEWVHELKKPTFSKVTKRPIKEKREKANGEEYETYQMEFIGRPICHGDPDILEDRGIDPKHCYACRMAKETDFVSGPVRRYAIHVFQYATRDGSTQIAEPFSGQCKVWNLTEKRFAEVVELMNEARTDDPRKIDVLLTQKGPETYQQYEMQLGRECEMLSSEDRTRFAVQTYQNNHAPDLVPYCGRAVEPKFLQEDVDTIVTAWRRVRAAEAGDDEGSGVPAQGLAEVDTSLLDMVGAPAGKPAAPAPAASAAMPAPEASQPPSGREEFNRDTTSVTEQDARDTPMPSSVRPTDSAPAATPATAAKVPIDFDKLMADLEG